MGRWLLCHRGKVWADVSALSVLRIISHSTAAASMSGMAMTTVYVHSGRSLLRSNDQLTLRRLALVLLKHEFIN
jgi:hypothetical protein